MRPKTLKLIAAMGLWLTVALLFVLNSDNLTLLLDDGIAPQEQDTNLWALVDENPVYRGLNPVNVRIAETTRSGILAESAGEQIVNIVVPTNGLYELNIGLMERARERLSTEVNIQVSLKQDESQILAHLKLHPETAEPWAKLPLDLSPWAGQEISLILQSDLQMAEAHPEAPHGSGLVWSLPWQGPSPAPSAPNVLLISLDTLRADHLGAWGYARRPTSPNIDKLAGEGLRFSNFFANAPWTGPSHLALFTGLLPSAHRVIQPNLEGGRKHRLFSAVDAEVPTLATILANKGYKTAAFTGGEALAGRLGFFRGFETWKESLFKVGPGDVEEIGTWIEGHRNEPFFLFLHTFEIHSPYDHSEFLGEVVGPEDVKKVDKIIDDIHTGIESGSMTTADSSYHMLYQLKQKKLLLKDVSEALYDSSIRDADRFIGQIMAQLEEAKVADNTLIVLVSDHGESFGERSKFHFYNAHSVHLYDELLHVPLIMRLPSALERGLVFETPTSHVDVLPTILQLLSVESPGELHGQSMLPLIKAGTQDREVYAEGTMGEEDWRSARTLDWKYMYLTDLEKDEPLPLLQERLYHVKTDTPEQKELHAKHPEQAQGMQSRLAKTLADAKRENAPSNAVDNELMRDLRALGYVE